MAIVTASSAFDNLDVNISWLEPTRTYTLLDNVGFVSQQGQSYEDALRTVWSDDPNYREFWLGTRLAFDPISKAFTAGMITALVGEEFDGNSWVQSLAIEGLSLSAATVSTAYSTVSTEDDKALIEDAFSGADTFNLSNDNDDTWGYAGNDTLNGNGGSDTLRGGDGNDSLAGGEGGDSLAGGAGDDTLDGGAGTDWADYRDADAAVKVNLGASGAQNTVGAGSDTFIGIEGVIGSAFADTLTGGSGNGVFESFVGSAGNDTIDGGAVTDTANFSDGNQIEYWPTAESGVNVNLKTGTASDGQGGTDTLSNFHFVIGTGFADTIIGSNSNVFEAFTGLAGNDFFDGGDLTKAPARINYHNSPAAVNVDIATGTAQDGYGSTDTFTNINFVRGSNFDDTLRGSDAIGWTESFEGRAGNDLIDGRGGRDTVRYDIAVGPVVVNLALGSATGADGSDTLLGIENVRGSNSFADTLTGDGADNQLEGRGGNDSLVGGDGQDTLLGSIGNDTLDGGAQAAIVPDDSGAFPGTLLFFDIVDYSAAAGAVNVNLATGSASGGDGSDVLSGIEGVRGTAGNDTLTGDSGHNLLRGNAGDDRLVGGAGFDIADLSTATVGVSASLVTGIVTGGAGNDTLSGIEMLIGGSGNDTLTGNSQNNIIRGNLGNDSMTGGGGIDSVDYRSAPGSVTVNLAAGTATGADGDDRLSGFEQIRGSDAGNDLLIGNDGANYLRGGGGGDVLVGGAGNDTLNGSTITDLVNYSDSNTVDYSAVGAGVAVNLQTGVAEDGQGGTDTLIDINFVIGTTQGDTLTGSTALLFEQFSPGAGNDTVDGGAVTDTLNLGNSNRVSYANTSESVTVDLALGTATGNAIGSDTLINIIQAAGSSANDTLRGSNNTLDEAFRGHGGNDLIDGRGGFDFARYDTFGSTGAKVNLATRIALDGLGGTDTLISIEGIRGSNANDTLTGGNAASNALERFLAMAGNDTINGGSGFDRAEYHMSTAAVTVTLGGAGVGTAQDGYGSTDTLISVEAVRGSVYDDTLTGSSVATLESFEGREGNDTINGVAGLDRVDYHYSKAGIVVDLAAGTASDGWGGADRLLNIDDVLGSRDFADSIVGSAGNNRLEGQGSNDTLVGAAGNDTLDGGSGNDTLNGGAGNDSLIGGAGADSMVGGDGNDTYVVGAGDRLNETGTTSSAADLVQSSITWSIAGAGQTTIERLTLTGTAFGGTGNSRANLITGNSAANSLSGGSGNDTLNGGSGNDTLSGGAGNDSLVGGSGADSMLGGSGNDTYVVGTGDRLNETGTTSSTADLVQSSISWALSGTGQAAIERLALIGSSAINGTGNDLANLITGNGAANRLGGGLRNDTLSGGLGNDTLVGGAGNDSLTGGGGRDVFRFDAALSAATNVDKVSGFVAADDAFQLENAVFVEVGAAGALAASAFRAGASATMASHRIVYHSSTGQLFFDSDGSGAAAQVLFATVAPGTAITAADFFVT